MLHINPKTLPEFKEWVAIDIETTVDKQWYEFVDQFDKKIATHHETDPILGNILSIALYDGKDVFIFLDFNGFDLVIPVIKDNSLCKIVQNAKYEYKWFLYHFGVEMNNFYDTMLAEGVLKEDERTPLALNDIIARRCGKFLSKEERETFSKHPGFAIKPVTPDQLDYMLNDVIYLYDIQQSQYQELKDKNLGKTIALEFETVPATAHLELNGVTFDQSLWEDQEGTMQVLIYEAEFGAKKVLGRDFIVQVPGTQNKKPVVREKSINELNLGSWQQLLAIYEQKFKIKLEHTDEKTLTSLIRKEKNKKSPNTEVIEFTEHLLSRKMWIKRLGYDYARFINPVTKRIHTEYNQMGTVTTRFSSRNPNLQQVPKPEEDGLNMRHLFVGDTEDYVIIRIDYSQQEPRILGQFTQDAALLRACNSQDVYLAFGKEVYGRDIEKGSKERFIAKTFVLASVYGSGIDTLMEQSGQPREFCENTRNLIYKTFPGIKNHNNAMNNQLQTYGYVNTLLGRRLYVKPNYNNACNNPIQGTGADMFKMALVKVHKGLTELKNSGKIDSNTRVWNLVHDEIEVHCHKDEVETVLPLVKNWMEEAGSKICPDVKHVAEAEYGYRWDK